MSISWSKPKKEEKFIGRKQVDLSMFKYGIHIPMEYWDDFLSVLSDRYIPKSSTKKVVMIFDDKTIEVDLRNISAKGRKNDTYQLRYDGKKEIIDYLKNKFKTTYYFIKKTIDANKNYSIPEEFSEYIDFYKTDKPNTYKVKTITKELPIDQSNHIKKEFFKYIGPKGTFNNAFYQKSYKLVLLLSLLNLVDDEGKADYDEVCEEIRKFYVGRHNRGLPAEESDSQIQKEINTLSLRTVKNVMNQKPYNVINDKGYVYKENINGNEYLCFNKELWQTFSDKDIQELKENLQEKLNMYYEIRFKKTSFYVYPTEYIEHIHKYITNQGYTYSIDTIKNFYLSLKAKPFVILAGISGTGKSKLVQLFARAIGATSENGRFNIIPVRPDWSDSADLLGYKTIEDKFQPGPLTTIIKRAMDNPNNPYFVCLDEMNLARVEYYFSDILSIIETRRKNGRIETDKLFKKEVFGKDNEARKEYGDLTIPDNLYIIGTVNMDETTFPFSKKVLDRANTIEFNEVDLSINFEDMISQEYIDSIILSNENLCSKYINIKDCKDEKEYKESIIKTVDILEDLNEILKKEGLHFGYRVRDEIIFYVLFGIKEGLMNFDKAIDYSVKQKILPRIQGSSFSIKEMLLELYYYFIDNNRIKYDPRDNGIYEEIYKYLDNNEVRYPLCARKVAYMIRRYDSDGFTTFWE